MSWRMVEDRTPKKCCGRCLGRACRGLVYGLRVVWHWREGRAVMGADGWLRIVKAEDFTIEFSDVQPEEIGLRAENIIGTRCLIAYNDTSDRDDMDDTWTPLGFTKARQLSNQQSRLRTIREKGENGRYQSEFMAKQHIPAWLESEAVEKIAALESDPADLAHSHRCDEAAWWFERYAERIMCWT